MTTAREQRRDEGFSLLEIMMSMTIMSIVMSITVGAIVQIYRTANRIENAALARAQLATSFARLDKEIRYATWVNSPGQVAGAWYVEFDVPPQPPAKSDDPHECRQLALKNGALTLAGWKLAADGSTVPPGPATTLGTGIAVISGVSPFTLYAAGSVPFATSPAAAAKAGVGIQFKPEFAQIRLQFNSVAGGTTLPFDITFTAQNNNADSPKSSDCADGRP
jgi:prepilin-type N-terminal cleavage/methylation domain-containing protein